MDPSQTYWTSPSSWTLLYKSERSDIGVVRFRNPRPRYPEVVVSKSYTRMDAQSPRSEQDAHCQVFKLHSNLLQYHASLNHEDKTTIYMEYADYGDGQKLLEVLKMHGNYDQQGILWIMAQLAGALHAMHHEGWVHRDIKPSNLFMFQSGQIKIGDFGCAKRVKDPSEPNTVVGTEAFIPPETTAAMAAHQTSTQNDPMKGDIYSLGSCFFSFITLGQLSVFGDVEDEDGEQLYKQFVMNSLMQGNVSSEIVRLVCSMVEVKPELRPTSLEVLMAIQRLHSIPQDLSQPSSSVAPNPSTELIPCPKCRNPQPDSVFLILDCNTRICQTCFAASISQQAPHLLSLNDFICPLCDQKLESIIVTSNQNFLPKETVKELTTLTFLGFETSCPYCKQVCPMFVRGKRIKRVKPHRVNCSHCKKVFCSFCQHRGSHKHAHMIPTTHCPHFDRKQF